VKSLTKPLLWLGGIVVVGAALVMLIPRGTEPSPAPAPETTASSPPAQTGQPATPPPAAGTGSDTLPWMNPNAASQQTAAATRARSAINPPQPSASEVARAVVAVREQAIHNERTADELLRQIDAMKASGQAPKGVNLDALRSNLLVAKHAQALARELAELTQQADTPARKKRIEDITHELQGLQSQLRYDVGGPTAAQATPAVLGRKQ